MKNINDFVWKVVHPSDWWMWLVGDRWGSGLTGGGSSMSWEDEALHYYDKNEVDNLTVKVKLNSWTLYINVVMLTVSDST